MPNVQKADTQIEPGLSPTGSDLSVDVQGVRRWPVIHGRTWRVVVSLGPLGLRIELERTDHAQA